MLQNINLTFVHLQRAAFITSLLTRFKTLTEEQRDKLLKKVEDNNEYLGWAIDILSPTYVFPSLHLPLGVCES